MDQQPSLYHTLIISRIEVKAEGFKVFYFTKESTANIVYKAGQYLTLVYKENDKEIRRSYSLITSPRIDEELAIGVKRIENGIFSRKLIDHATGGTHVITTGASGFFVLPDNVDTYKTIFLFAAGSGITPIYSLLKTLLFQHTSVQVVLMYSSRNEAQTVFYHELILLQEKFRDRFVLRFVFSAVKLAIRSHVNTEIIHALFKECNVQNGKNVLCYVCGPHHYMNRCMYAFRLMNVPWENIKKESFNADKVVTKAEPPDKNPHSVYIKIQGKAYNITVQYPQSILHTALQQHINLPYSCETGRCGSCAARCMKGDVWMSYNEVLTEDDIKAGWVLTCTGFPLNDVELTFL